MPGRAAALRARGGHLGQQAARVPDRTSDQPSRWVSVNETTLATLTRSAAGAAVTRLRGLPAQMCVHTASQASRGDAEDARDGTAPISGPVSVAQVSQPDPAAYLGARLGERDRRRRQRRSRPTWLTDACLRRSRRALTAEAAFYPLHCSGQGVTHELHCPPDLCGSHRRAAGFRVQRTRADRSRECMAGLSHSPISASV